MLRLNPNQRALLAEKLTDVANLVAAALVIGWLLGEPRPPVLLVTAGLVVWAAIVGFALALSRDRA